MADARELDSGIAAEAAAAAGALALGRLIVLATLPETEAPALARFTALGWTLRRVPAASAEDLEAAVSAALRAQKPTLIAILTNAAEPESPIATLAPSPLATGTRRSWLKRLHRHAAAAAFQEAIRGAVLPRLPASADPASLQAVPAEALQALFNRAATLMPDLAMLPPPSEAAPDPVWSNRPHAAGAALLGMALHGGLLPVGRFPAAAADAIRPAERAAAALGLRQIHILAGCDPVLAGSLHDAGADIANLATYSPADAADRMRRPRPAPPRRPQPADPRRQPGPGPRSPPGPWLRPRGLPPDQPRGRRCHAACQRPRCRNRPGRVHRPRASWHTSSHRLDSLLEHLPRPGPSLSPLYP
jgi:hypothetical protein